MDHWFDTLSRSLGSHALTRRTVFSWSSRLGLAAGLGAFGRPSSSASAAPVAAVPATVGSVAAAPAAAASTCIVNDSYGVLKAVVTASSADAANPLTLTHTFIAEVGSGAAHSTLTITPGSATTVAPDDVVVRMAASTFSDQRGNAYTTLGKRFTGATARRAQFSTDGHSVEGIVDGRPTEPTPLAGDLRGIRFKDGGPLKPLTDTGPSGSTQGMQQAVGALLAQSRGQLGACTPDPKASHETSTCTQCQLTCRQSFIQCSMSAMQSSLAAGALAPGAYLGAASATCDRALQQCMQTCKSSGACCPDFCKGDAACCRSAWGCCPPTSTSPRTLSKAWPTCPRCGSPPWPAVKPSVTRSSPTRPGR
jgi:hypothetical protein